jgi:hypothetical protein
MVLISKFQRPSLGQVNVDVCIDTTPESVSTGTLNVAVYGGVANLFNKNFQPHQNLPKILFQYNMCLV